MSVCKIEGCENESVQATGIYGRLCETHALEKKQLRASRQNGAEQGAAAAEIIFDAHPEAGSILELAMQLDESHAELEAARAIYRRQLTELERRVANLTNELAR